MNNKMLGVYHLNETKRVLTMNAAVEDVTRLFEQCGVLSAAEADAQAANLQRAAIAHIGESHQQMGAAELRMQAAEVNAARLSRQVECAEQGEVTMRQAAKSLAKGSLMSRD